MCVCRCVHVPLQAHVCGRVCVCVHWCVYTVSPGLLTLSRSGQTCPPTCFPVPASAPLSTPERAGDPHTVSASPSKPSSGCHAHSRQPTCSVGLQREATASSLPPRMSTRASAFAAAPSAEGHPRAFLDQVLGCVLGPGECRQASQAARASAVARSQTWDVRQELGQARSSQHEGPPSISAWGSPSVSEGSSPLPGIRFWFPS